MNEQLPHRKDAVDTPPIEQLKDTSAMLAVLLEDIYDIAPEGVKNRIFEEIGKINQCIRNSERVI